MFSKYSIFIIWLTRVIGLGDQYDGSNLILQEHCTTNTMINDCKPRTKRLSCPILAFYKLNSRKSLAGSGWTLDQGDRSSQTCVARVGSRSMMFLEAEMSGQPGPWGRTRSNIQSITASACEPSKRLCSRVSSRAARTLVGSFGSKSCLTSGW